MAGRNEGSETMYASLDIPVLSRIREDNFGRWCMCTREKSARGVPLKETSERQRKLLGLPKTMHWREKWALVACNRQKKSHTMKDILTCEIEAILINNRRSEMQTFDIGRSQKIKDAEVEQP